MQSKVSKTIALIYRVCPYVNTVSLILIYFSLIHCFINYANITWSCTQPSKLKKIHSLQKHACIIIYGKKKGEHNEKYEVGMKLI